MAATNRKTADDRKAPEKVGIADLDESDLKHAAEYIIDTMRRRKSRRDDLEQRWKEIDRQIKMTPFIVADAAGRPLSQTSWSTEIEMPQQAQALEVLKADARRLLFPDDRMWFRAHGSMEQEKLEALASKNLIPGLTEETEEQMAVLNELRTMQGSPSRKVDQEDVDSLIEGALSHYHAAYDYREHWDMLHTEAFSRGTYVGRVKMVKRDKAVNGFRGAPKDAVMIPAMIPRSIKNVYLDDTVTAVMNDGVMISPSYIEVWWQKLDDLRLAAEMGDADPDNENGGWCKETLANLKPLDAYTKANLVELVEYEGDLIIPQQMTRALFVQNVIFTVALGQGGMRAVVRRRKREFPFRSYFHGCYHRDDIDSPYGTSPLMLGYPIQMALTEAVNMMKQAAVLNAQPPISFSPADHYLKAQGGPRIEPQAMWEAMSKVEQYKIGDLGGLQGVVVLLIKLYEEVTGVSHPRLGAQGKSHTTAFSTDSEITRGLIRTVNYISGLMFGSMPTCLSMEYEVVKKTLKNDLVYVPKYRQFVKLSGSDLPELATFDVFGAAGPVERREREERIMRAITMALKIEPLVQQLGGKPLDLDKVRERILEEGGLPNADEFFGPAAGPPMAPGIAGAGGSPGGSGVLPGPGASPGVIPMGARGAA